jgi:hypothetical protein
MLQRLEHQQKERLALIAAIRDLKSALKTEQEHGKRTSACFRLSFSVLEQQTRFMYQELQAERTAREAMAAEVDTLSDAHLLDSHPQG